MSKSLLKDVSISELLGMRDSGMTNRDIANTLDVSIATIYKYIGAQPPQMRKKRETAPYPPVILAEAHDADTHDAEDDASLIVDNRIVSLAGLFAGYRVDVRSRKISIFIEDDVDAMVVPFDKVRDFARELNALARHVGNMKVGNEAW